eukprot:GHVR01080376.1.p1 GENE.GHVR01080376.1~~GHVR01080376.1.p1  ORF type:complete len:349 (+),score=83.06 GHVR01080376.1:163-1209(+)
MALSHLEKRGDLKLGLPLFVREVHEKETAHQILLIRECLNNVDTVARNISKFSYCCRLIAQIEEKEIFTPIIFDDRKYIIIKLFELLQHNDLSLSQWLRVGDLLTELLEGMRCRYLCPMWMRREARNTHTTHTHTTHTHTTHTYTTHTQEESLAELIPWEYLREAALKHINIKLNIICSNSASKVRSYLGVLKKIMCASSRILKYSSRISQKIGVVYFKSIDDCDWNKHDVYAHLLFACVALPCNAFTSPFMDASIFRWWRRHELECWSSFHPLMFTFLYRAIKTGWATGKPVISLIYNHLPFIGQCILRYFNLPVSRSNALKQRPKESHQNIRFFVIHLSHVNSQKQ